MKTKTVVLLLIFLAGIVSEAEAQRRLSDGAIVGIVVGSAVFFILLIIIVVAMLFCCVMFMCPFYGGGQNYGWFGGRSYVSPYTHASPYGLYGYV